MYYVSNACIFVKMGTSALMKAYVWSTNSGNASWTVNQGHRQGMKPANVMKLANGKIAKSSKSLFHNSSFMVVDIAL